VIARAALLAPVLLLPAAAAKDDPLAGRIAGAPVQCIDPHLTQGPEIVDQHTILYRESGRRVWRAEPVGDCPDLTPDATLIVVQFGSRLCADDRFRARRPGDIIPGATCRFGPFTPYDKPPRR
jgi:hypothetical protein